MKKRKRKFENQKTLKKRIIQINFFLVLFLLDYIKTSVCMGVNVALSSLIFQIMIIGGKREKLNILRQTIFVILRALCDNNTTACDKFTSRWHYFFICLIRIFRQTEKKRKDEEGRKIN